MKCAHSFLKIAVVFLFFAFSANAQNDNTLQNLQPKLVGAPVLGVQGDTLFFIYNKMGVYTAIERAEVVTAQIKHLYNNEFVQLDSLKLVRESDSIVNIMYSDILVMSVSEIDALHFSPTATSYELAKKNMELIRASLQAAISEHQVSRMFIRIALTILVFALAGFIIWLLNFLYKKALKYFASKKEHLLHDLKYKNYTFLSKKQLRIVVVFLLNILRWLLIILFVYLILPIVFSIFPFTHEWANVLFSIVLYPFKKIFLSIWHYLPNFVTILAIFFVFKYLIKFVRYIFGEIASDKLKLPGFYPDWAMPTFHIIRFLLWALAFVMMYSASPWAESRVFAGVSVFLGLLVSLGSTSAISNIVAGLVITYMRPFKEGDRIRFGDQVGDVIEKSILVTRLRTIKNEEITIPNSTILSGNTVNYSAFSQDEGLIIYAKVTMGYDVAWQDVHDALIESALRTDKILKDPKPFVLQLSLDDSYVSYQINAYIRDANAQATIYSELYAHIQDVFKERGLELLAPNYEVSYTDDIRIVTRNHAKGNEVSVEGVKE